MGDPMPTDETKIAEWNIDKKLGSIYQDDKIVGITRAEQLCLAEPLTIKGGPLAAEALTVFPNGIPAGTSMEEILTALFLKEIWPEPSVTSTASLSLSVTAPTPVLTAATKSGSLVEVGDTITIASMTANSVEVGGTETTTLSGFDYGYSANNDNKKDNDGPTVSATRSTPAANSSAVYSLKVSTSGMTGATVPVITSDATASEVVCKSSTNEDIAFTGTAVKGDNTVTAEETGVGYTATVPGIPEYYICSNLGNTSPEHKTASIE
jgi:hypothetical protein